MSTPAQIHDAVEAAENIAIDRQIRYLCEANSRIHEVKTRVRCARHFLRRRDPGHAADELLHVINEARRLRLHLESWNLYVIPPAPGKKATRPHAQRN